LGTMLGWASYLLIVDSCEKGQTVVVVFLIIILGSFWCYFVIWVVLIFMIFCMDSICSKCDIEDVEVILPSSDICKSSIYLNGECVMFLSNYVNRNVNVVFNR
jgi:hypothetical protein